MGAVTRDLSPSYLASRVTTNGAGCILSPVCSCGLPDPYALHSCSFRVGQEKGEMRKSGSDGPGPSLATGASSCVCGGGRILLTATLKLRSQDLGAPAHIGLM